jgi:hyperosmotically inducible protein
MKKINENPMNPVCTLGSIVMVIFFALGFAVPLSALDRSLLVQVQNQQSPSGEKKETKETNNGSKTSVNIYPSTNLKLKLAFMADPRLFPYDIDCRVEEKSVELTGVVSLEEEKNLATEVTTHLMKEKEIINHIEVRPSLSATMQATRDSRLTEFIKQRFAKSQTLRETDFEIVTIRGVVSLSGQTRFQVIALEAAQAAREIPGVIAVNTHHIRLEAGND